MTIVTLRPPLRRPRRAVLGGVCAGIAIHLGRPLPVVRALAVALAVCGGAGVLLYLWLWALVPLVPLEPDEAEDAATVRRAVPVAAILVGAAALAAVVTVGVSPVRDDLTVVALVVVATASSAAVIWNLSFDRHDPGRQSGYGLWIRMLSAAAALLAGIATLINRPSAVTAVLGVGVVVLGVGVIVAPRVVTLWSELMGERATRVRQEQRAEIAAHLHDSVLQTLALIQNRAGASSEVARIARAQERELRDWLFAGDLPEEGDLATELRHAAAAMELDHAVRIDVVTAGESVGLSSGAIAAAAREAMLNAARHAGGEVSVYLESSADGIDVFVRDRGPGVDLASLSADRLGIRESIIGRMSRAGGTATVRPGAAGVGTEVHLHLEAPR